LTLAAVACAGAAGAGAWWAVERSRSDALAREVREAVSARRFDEAQRAINRWAARRPHDGAPYYWRARVEVARNHAQPALDAMDEAVRRHYDVAPVAVLRAVLLARAGRHQEAEPILRKAFDESKALDPEVAEALARVYLSTFRLYSASKVLDRWVKEDPDDPRPYLYLTEIDQRSDLEPSVLIGHYRMALQRDPTLDKARLGLADTLRDTQRSDEAEAEYAAYLARNPRSVDGHVGAGQVALRKGDLKAAERHFAEALAVDPREPVALRELAQIDLRAGRYARARDRLKTVVEVDPYDPEVRLSYARALKMSGDEARSREETAVVERLRKEHSQMADLRKELVARPTDPDLRFRAARWLLEHGHDAEGLEWTQLILREAPGHPDTCRFLTEYYRKKGNIGLSNFYKTAASPPGKGDGPSK
jgi:predicted Zn-dependent protease